jgi:hypothetical protein
MAGIEVLAEGYDEKPVGYVIMARPTMSKALHPQSIGRGLPTRTIRALPGSSLRLLSQRNGEFAMKGGFYGTPVIRAPTPS